jgi:hypothetical protein
MFIGRSPVTSSADATRTGPHARYASDFRTRTKSWKRHAFVALSM